MIWHSYYLGETILKATEPLRLLETERGIVEIEGKTLAIPVMLNGSLEGYVYHGRGKLVLDTVVETEQGAVGRPVEKGISQSFLMLGNTGRVHQRLSPASQEDLSGVSYTKQEEFISSAENLLNKFSREGKMHRCRHSSDGSVFVFQNEANELDFLLAVGGELVYKTMDTIFISNRRRVILKDPSEVVCVSNGRSVVVKR
jgi:hypothetical protein